MTANLARFLFVVAAVCAAVAAVTSAGWATAAHPESWGWTAVLFVALGLAA